MAMGLQAGTAMPLVPLTLEREGVDKLTIGIVTATWAIGMLAFGTRIPGLASRFGAARVIVMAAVAGATINVAYTLTSGPIAWGILTFLHGVVGGVPWVVSEIWINLVVEETQRGRAVAVYAALMALGMAVGPLVLQLVGVYGPRPFLACAGMALLVALPLLASWNSAPAIAPTREGGFARILLLVPALLLGALASGLGEQAAFTFLPIYGLRSGVPAETGVLWLSAFVIGNIVLQWPIGWLADHADRRVVLAGCALASAALTACLPALDVKGHAVLALLVAWGGISFAIYSVGLALLGQRFKGDDIARANTALTSVYTLGGMVGPPIAGTALDLAGAPGFGLSLAGCYAVAGVGALLALRRPG